MRKSFLAALLGVLLLSGGCDKLKELTGDTLIKWECVPASYNAVSCVFENTGDAPGEACFDLIVVCEGTRHVARKCSGKLTPQGKTTKLVDGFDPPILETSVCSGMEFENEKVTR